VNARQKRKTKENNNNREERDLFFWHTMSQSFDSLMHGRGEGGGRGSVFDGYTGYPDRQSSDDIPESTTTTTNTTTTAGDDGNAEADAIAARDDDFIEESNFESNLRRRKGKIISCAKETIENGKNHQKLLYTHMYICFLYMYVYIKCVYKSIQFG